MHTRRLPICHLHKALDAFLLFASASLSPTQTLTMSQTIRSSTTALFLASIIVSGCGAPSRPTPADVEKVVASRFQKLGIKFKDLTVTDLNCANEATIFRCTFTSTAKDLDQFESATKGKEIYFEKPTVSPNVHLVLVKGDAGWMETH